MNYCNHCGHTLSVRIPDGDTLPRHVCGRCGTIHYENPKLVVGCLPEWEDRVLLCRRAIKPRYGLWTLPAGFMENGETTAEGAARETLEEANARIEIIAPYALVNLPDIDQIYLLYRAQLLDLNYHPGQESLEVDLFHEHEIPWAQLAFPTIEHTLHQFFQDRRNGHFELHTADIRY